MVEKYTLWKKVSNHGRGCICDGSETWTKTYEYFIVAQSDDESFGDYMAEMYGSQDYSYIVNFKEMAFFNSLDELKEVAKALNLEVAKQDFSIQKLKDEFVKDVLKNNKKAFQDLDLALRLDKGC